MNRSEGEAAKDEGGGGGGGGEMEEGFVKIANMG